MDKPQRTVNIVRNSDDLQGFIIILSLAGSIAMLLAFMFVCMFQRQRRCWPVINGSGDPSTGHVISEVHITPGVD